MTCESEFQYLYIACNNVALQAAYNAPPEWFVTGYLRIPVQPDEYTKIRQGNAPKAVRTFNAPTYRIQLREIGFSVRLTEDDARLRYILEHIERSSISSTGQFITPVTILDYVKPDPGAFVAAVSGNSNPYTIRIGMIEVEPGSGTMGENTNRKGTGGLKFVFTQTALSKA
jgi:hypothetical protein